MTLALSTVGPLARLAPLLPRFAERADASDQEASFPAENFRDLTTARLLSLVVPTRHGGLGATYRVYATIVEQIARACPSTGLCFAMHCGGIGDLRLGTDQQQARFGRAVMAEGAIFTRAFTEPGSGSHFMRPAAEAVPADGGYRLSGTKAFVTNAGAAHYAVVNARLGDTTAVFVVPLRAEGVLLSASWDALGMRASDSRTLRFLECFVPAENRLAPDVDAATALGRFPPYGAIGVAADSVGIAQAALDVAVAQARSRAFGDGSPALGEYQATRFALARMSITTEAARLLVDRAAAAADAGETDVDICIARAKYAATEGGFEVANQALQLVGGRGYLHSHVAQRLLRDARAGSLMAHTSEQNLDLIGSALLDP
jgi:alkylation response protein AidB-like acyl-CoA dehydrogenase